MTDGQPPASANSRADAQVATSLSGLPFIARKLTLLQQAFGEAPGAEALREAQAALQAHDFRQAWQKLRAAQRAYTPKEAITAEMAAAAQAASRMLKPLNDWQERLVQATRETAPLQTPEPPAEAGEFEEVDSSGLLERGVFSQLLTAAQHSGLVRGLDAIISVRDREFPTGNYQKAFDMIEYLYSQLNAQAARRQTDLRREETQYKAGSLKMSAREWAQRQKRVIEEDQKIDRARRRFARVLDGLRVMRFSAEDENHSGDHPSPTA